MACWRFLNSVNKDHLVVTLVTKHPINFTIHALCKTEHIALALIVHGLECYSQAGAYLHETQIILVPIMIWIKTYDNSCKANPEKRNPLRKM